MLKFLLGLYFVFFFSYLSAQPVSYPKNYFRNPLDVPMQLSANFGEPRPDHSHMGIDIRTQRRVNLRVYAAASGYIAHIGVRPQSFGRFIIINHPNGYSTLYAHLNDFFPELGQYVTEQQYLQETWEIELDMSKEKFPVSKGQFIAYSGNTGGSQGPHLHFEIRDTKTDRCINPLFFGLPVQDNVPPGIVKLAMYNRDISVYEQTPVLFSVKKTSSGYILPKTPVIKTSLNKISFAIQAYDQITGLNNRNGIYSASLFIDAKPIIGFAMDSIDYNETTYINAQIDYKYRFSGGAYLQHLSQLPGNHGIVYKKMNGDGVINLTDTNVHAVRIEIKDPYLNSSELNFFIQYDESLANPSLQDKGDSIDQHFIPNQVNVLEKPGFEIYLPENCLYDTIQALYSRTSSSLQNAVTELYRVNDPSIPVHISMTIRIKPDKPTPTEWDDKIIIRRTYGEDNSVRKAEWQGSGMKNDQWLSAKFGDFGNFQAFIDTEPPKINKLGKGDTINLSAAKRIVFQPTDNFGVIKNFRAELDGQWIRFTNDKRKSWIYEFDEHCPFGVHELKVVSEDLVGNTTIRTWWFKRYPYTPPKKKSSYKKRTFTRKPVKKTSN